VIRAISGHPLTKPLDARYSSAPAAPAFVRGDAAKSHAAAQPTDTSGALDGGLRTQANLLRTTYAAKREASATKHKEQVELSATCRSLISCIALMKADKKTLPVQFSWHGKPATLDVVGRSSIHLRADNMYLHIKDTQIKQSRGLDGHKEILDALYAGKRGVVDQIDH
jgi:hypothetical protein